MINLAGEESEAEEGKDSVFPLTNSVT